MRIAIEAQRLFRPKKHGMEVVTLELIKAMQELGPSDEIRVFIKDDKDDQCLHNSNNVIIHKTSSHNYPYWEQVLLPKLVGKFKPDILHCTSNTGPLIGGTPIILTLHDIIYLESINFDGTPYQNFGNIYRRFIVPQIVSKAKKIITVSEFEKEKIIKKLNLPEDKISVVYNAKSEKFKKIDDLDLLESFKVAHNLPDKFILFLGNTAPKKNTPSMIKAYCEYLERSSNGLKMVVLDLKEEVLNKILADQGFNKFREYFVLPGYIRASEMPLIYNLAELYVYPSLRESFGLPIVEAMACNTPVITSNTSSMPEVAGGAAKLIDPFNHSTITEALLELADNEEKKEDLKIQGLKRSSFFSWENAAGQMLKYYHELIN
ncbi:glycosyltransferase family 4 protein [Marinigracilibium pacificum]|uniref:Glycosyltransferase family 4 protein n=1 Tax=Marinigracilibium pacificum TaxID=2729599 RepID=A0A848IYA9_9BACT|nr:glycosyltransferase family 1 protein [Marinigracilibium pacificum]NMM47234.1 glycosyltransferase family 4 protein [Marinigracilibium pacificum]